MQYPIIVREKTDDQYEAEPLGIPELRIRGTDEADALKKVTEALGKWLSSAKVIQVEVPTQEGDNPWMEAFGRSSNDPDFDEVIEAVNEVRTAGVS